MIRERLAIAAGRCLVAAAAAAIAAGSAPAAERARYLMGTVCRIAAEHARPGAAEPLIESAFAEIARWEAILSDYDSGSELSRLNASGTAPFTCTPDLFAFLSASRALAAATDGAFDPTVGPLVDLYALRDGGRWPAREEIAAALGAVGYRKLRLDPADRTARFGREGMRLDPGAIGKGFALDAAGRILREGGASWALLDFGGQILGIGAGPEGCGFAVEVAPNGRASSRRGGLRLRDASAATSANDERGLVVGGRPLGHILDPRTGLPASAATSVTVVARTSALADALSTALFVLGPEEGLEAASRLGVEAMFTLDGGSGMDLRSTPRFTDLQREGCARDAPATRTPHLTESHE